MKLPFLLVFVLFSGCAYRVGFVGRTLPQGHQFVAVPLFKNVTFRPGIEVEFTNAMIREIERSGVAKVVDKENADVVLKGFIEKLDVARDSIRSQQQSETNKREMPIGTDLALRRNLVINVRYQLIRKSDQKIIWAVSVKSERGYDTPRILMPVLNSANPIYDLSAMRATLKKMAADTSTKAFDRLTENF